MSAAISALVWIAILLNIVKSFLNNLHNCSVSQIHYYIIQQFVGGNVAMIIRFQLGNLCMRNKGTLFSAHKFPTYHQTPIMCYLFAFIVCGGTWYRPSIKLRYQSYVIDTLSLCTPYVLGKPWFLPVHLCLIASNRRIGHSVTTTHFFAFVFWVTTRFRPVHQRQLSNIHN